MPLTFTKVRGQERNEPGSSVTKITASAIWTRLTLPQSFARRRESKQNVGRKLVGKGHGSARDVNVPGPRCGEICSWWAWRAGDGIAAGCPVVHGWD